MWYLIFLIVTLVEYAFEVRLSIRNSKQLIQQGAIEIGRPVLMLMASSYFAMYIGAFAEFLLIPKTFQSWWPFATVAIYLAAKALKFWAIGALGRYWTMRVLIVPDTQVVTAGPYRWIRHPNYVAIALEIAGTTLPGKAYITCVAMLLLFAALLLVRIRQEEAGLLRYTDYTKSMADKRRFVP